MHGRDKAAEHSSLRVTQLQPVSPLDNQLGSAEPLTTPEDLRAVLFGRPEVNTYAIIEAARFTYLPEILENREFEHCCLFKNAAYYELKDVAPWIVRLDERDSLTRNLLTRSDAHWHLWDDEPALYLRSRASLAELWQQLRKFTRVQDQRGQWFYFRFWEYHASMVQGNMPDYNVFFPDVIANVPKLGPAIRDVYYFEPLIFAVAGTQYGASGGVANGIPANECFVYAPITSDFGLNIVGHELGHTVGLHHPNYAPAVVSQLPDNFRLPLITQGGSVQNAMYSDHNNMMGYGAWYADDYTTRYEQWKVIRANL